MCDVYVRSFETCVWKDCITHLLWNSTFLFCDS